MPDFALMKAIDLFAGLGGFSEGARLAGVDVVWASNHWRPAVDTHQLNHPEAAHVCQDLHQADWAAVPQHDIVLASPSCQGHSRARGTDKPRHDAARSTAWAVVACCEVHRPAFFIVENVQEFLSWTLYPAWSQAMAALGYTLAPHVLDAADHGVPQNRVRVFIVASRSKAPLKLALPAHSRHLPATTMLGTAGAWSPVATKCANTRARITNGRKAHGARFLIAYYGNEKGGRALTRPIGTITTKDRYALVDGDRMRMLTADEYRRGMGFRAGYQLPASTTLAKHMLGNAVCPPVARDIIASLLQAA